MPQIANIGHGPRLFRDKSGKLVEIAPGTAANVDIDRDDVNLRAFENARLIEVGGTEAKAKKAAREKSPAPTEEPASTE